METDIRYSIITPVYNRADCILRCMKSVERAMNLMGGGKIEHIIVDDGSSDATVSIIEEFATHHTHIVFVKFEHNKGTNAARNEAIRRARGEWCIILDSDDYFVDDALQTIANTMNQTPGYRHYMFAPDDMRPYYEHNPIILGSAQKMLTYPDFLNGYVGGDFIHVCSTDILRRHPFDERLRIYEGVFFLMFFKDAQQMLFTNKIVTIRERNRKDSVTKDVLRTSDKVIRRSILSNEIYLHYFEDDMKNLGMQRQLRMLYNSLLDNYALLGEYEKANKIYEKRGKATGMKEWLNEFVIRVKGGRIYKWILFLYLILKYRLFNEKLA